VTAIPVGPTWTASMGLDARNGMGGVTVSYDAERTITEVFAGDRQGHLWRFDFTDGVPAGAKGFDGASTPLFRAMTGTKPQPISAAPRLAAHPLGGRYVLFGTGKLHDVGDSGVVDAQGIYGVWLKDGTTSQIAASQVQTLSVSTSSGTRSFSISGIDWRTKLGWTVPLTGGERVISDPSLDLGTMTIASFKPDGSESCDGGGTSYMYRFDFATGNVTGAQVVGVVGAITPLTSIPTTARTQSRVDPRTVVTGFATGNPNAPQGSQAQCRVYSSSIQGRPNVIAQNCPGFTPLRVWRQPVR
ncbi:MAG TPA: PilC/PilY family type IV pilus protein, partial [Burkholderiaceae bacterium]|nr:PilC/PilY family type IV pilus protein [Burkholderiaceae bacterium]